MLYIVPTPIGNLEDITLRALRVLKEVDFILAEDTRTTRHLLNHFGIEKQLRAYHIHNEHASISQTIQELQQGANIALVSDAGTPGISDPGFLIIREARKNNIEIVSLPGATACITALSVSGLPCDAFHFEGFLPHKKGRMTRWKYLCTLENTFIVYESTHRIIKFLEETITYCGAARTVCVCRELTKLHEEIVCDSAQNVLAHFIRAEAITKGEFVVVISGV